MKIRLHHNKVKDSRLTYVLIFGKNQQSEWIMVRHKKRATWEVPAGHIEKNENPTDAAKRELFEETGAECYTIEALFDYSVRTGFSKKYGRVFWAEIEKLGPLPDFEIAEVKYFNEFPSDLTYPEIQKKLLEEVIKTKASLK
jgi:8-oxo-dGTP diphosphatase